MKHFTLFLLTLTLIATTLSAQTHQFGFVAKVGNVVKPERIVQQTGFQGSIAKSVQWTKPGNMTVLGIVHRFRINKQLFLSGELLFRYANVSEGNESTYTSGGYVSIGNQTDHISESSIALPVKLEWAPFKKRRTSFGVGAGVSRLIGIEIATRYSSSNSLNPEVFTESDHPKRAVYGRNFPIELSFNAGVYHQLNQQTSIGIELTREPQRGYNYYEVRPQDALIDVLVEYYGYSTLESIDQLSLTVSIRHFLLKDK